MKEGVGASVGRSGNIGGVRASGTALGVKSLGGSFSPGARSESAFSAFSSKGLSTFKSEAISKPSISILNPNFGKEAKPSFARNNALARSQSFFDISRPIRTSPISKPAEFGVKVNIKNGTERFSKSARRANLAPKSMFDVNRSLVRTLTENNVTKSTSRVFELGKNRTVAKPEQIRTQRLGEKTRQKITNPNYFSEVRKTVARRTVDANLNPRVKAERVKSISPFRDTVVLWSRQESAHKALKETHLKPVVVEQVRRYEEVRKLVSRTKEMKAVKRKKEMTMGIKKDRMLLKRKMRVGGMVRISPELSKDARMHIYADIKEAQRIAVPIIIRARNVSYKEAVVEAAKALEARHKGKITIMPLEAQLKPATQMESKVSVSEGYKLSTATQYAQETEAQVPESGLKNTEPKVQPRKIIAKIQTVPIELKRLYFKKDIRANNHRVERAISALKMLTGKKQLVSGEELVNTMGLVPVKAELSELTRHQGFDKSFEHFIKAIKRLATTSNTAKVEHNIIEASKQFTAVRLSQRDDSADSATGVEAQNVYGGPLSGVEAFVEADDSSMGKLYADGLAKSVKVIKQEKVVLYKEQKADMGVQYSLAA